MLKYMHALSSNLYSVRDSESRTHTVDALLKMSADVLSILYSKLPGSITIIDIMPSRMRWLIDACGTALYVSSLLTLLVLNSFDATGIIFVFRPLYNTEAAQVIQTIIHRIYGPI